MAGNTACFITSIPYLLNGFNNPNNTALLLYKAYMLINLINVAKHRSYDEYVLCENMGIYELSTWEIFIENKDHSFSYFVSLLRFAMLSVMNLSQLS